MIDGKSLARISDAQQKARNVRLSGTAERLGALHAQLEGFKALPDGLKGKKAQWALAKLEDTEKTLACEERIAEKAATIAERNFQMRAYGRIAQLGSLMGLLFAGSAALRTMASDPDLTTARTLTVTGLIILAGAVAWKAVGSIFSGWSFEDSVKAIRRTMAECRDGLTKMI